MIELDVVDGVDGLLCATFSSEAWVVNIHASADDFAALERIESAKWDSRSFIRAGVASGKPVFWSYSAGIVTVLVGDDDETWDLAVMVPVELVERLVHDAAEFRFNV